MNGILGRKIEMTQVFDDRGRLVAVTLLKAGPCVVTQVKTKDRDGYDAVQVGLVERASPRRVNKPARGICEKASVAPVKNFGEFRLPGGAAAPARGASVTCDIFAPGDVVDVVGRSKGRGFKGVVRRHRFRGGGDGHGSMFHRAPGSIGASAFPSRVFKGMRMGGHMGDVQVTAKHLRVVHVDAENGLIAVTGAVPGARHGLVRIHRAQAAATTRKGD